MPPANPKEIVKNRMVSRLQAARGASKSQASEKTIRSNAERLVLWQIAVENTPVSVCKIEFTRLPLRLCLAQPKFRKKQLLGSAKQFFGNFRGVSVRPGKFRG